MNKLVGRRVPLQPFSEDQIHAINDLVGDLDGACVMVKDSYGETQLGHFKEIVQTSTNAAFTDGFYEWFFVELNNGETTRIEKIEEFAVLYIYGTSK